jgi:hypothetical protein
MDNFKIVCGYLFGAIAFGVCVYVAICRGTAPHLQVMLCLFGGALGWVVGILSRNLRFCARQARHSFAVSLGIDRGR